MHRNVNATQPGSGWADRHGYFSLRTPLKGCESDFTSLNLPVSESLLVHLPFAGLKTCDLSLTAPIRWPSPFGGFVAMIVLLSGIDCPQEIIYKKLQKRKNV
jgi:hypothetical protein